MPAACRLCQALGGIQVQRHFYALPEDLLVIFELAEASQPLRYTPTETLRVASPKFFLTGTELPTLRDPPPSDSAISGHSYLVTLRDAEPVGRKIDLTSGGVRYAFDQLSNPDSIELLPGARHESGAILYGRIATCSNSAVSGRLFGIFKSAIGKRFRKINAFWVGPRAEEAWRHGARLTIGLASPPEYDLREPARMPSNNSLERTRQR